MKKSLKFDMILIIIIGLHLLMKRVIIKKALTATLKYEFKEDVRSMNHFAEHIIHIDV